MKKTLMILTAVCFAAAPLFLIIYKLTSVPVFYSLAVTFGTTFYHCAMRLTVGAVINAKFHNGMNCGRKWFIEKPFEKKLYKALKVKKWKSRVPTFAPENFSLTKNSAEKVAQATCQAEVVHEIDMALSFAPLAFSVWAGALPVFAATSCAACVLDGVFAIVQRYNRPRLLKAVR